MVLKEDALAKLAALKNEIDPEGLYTYEDESGVADDVFSDDEEQKMQQQFIQQFNEEQDAEDEDDFFDDGPELDNEKVEIVYSGGVIRKYKNIAEIELRVDEVQYASIIEELKRFSKEKSPVVRSEVLAKISAVGPAAVGVIFQKCRIFELVSEDAKTQVAHLVAKLSHQDLDNRLFIKGILEYSTNESYLKLAIRVAGILNDQHMTVPLQKHLFTPRYLKESYSALVKLRATKSVPSILKAISQLDSSNRVLIEDTITISKSFNVFGLEAFDDLFEAYVSCQNAAIREIYILAIRSYGDKALPKMKAHIKNVKVDSNLFQIFKTIGGLRTEAASEVLKELLNGANEHRKADIVSGISSTGDTQFVDIVLDELLETQSNFYRSKCLHALANIAGHNNEAVRKKIEHLTKQKDGNIHVDAINCLARLGDRKCLAELIHLALYGEESEKTVALKSVSFLPLSLMERVLDTLVTANEDHTFTLVTALQKKHRLPRKTGEVLVKKLKEPLPDYVRIEIYRLIARHEGLETRLVPDGFILKALEQEAKISDTSRISKELRKMLKSKMDITIGTLIGRN